MDIYSETKSHIKIKTYYFLLHAALLIAACNPYETGRRNFLFRDHPYLMLVDAENNEVDSYDYMNIYNRGAIMAELLRPDVRVLDRNINRYYEGRLVSFGRSGTTMQAFFYLLLKNSITSSLLIVLSTRSLLNFPFLAILTPYRISSIPSML